MCSEDGNCIRKTTEYMMIRNTELVGVVKIATILSLSMLRMTFLRE